jgi:hypothetical protein
MAIPMAPWRGTSNTASSGITSTSRRSTGTLDA